MTRHELCNCVQQRHSGALQDSTLVSSEGEAAGVASMPLEMLKLPGLRILYIEGVTDRFGLGSLR